MKVNTLISTIEEDIPMLLDKMNVEGEVLVSAQNDNNKIYNYETEKYSAQIYEIEGRGVSRNRNLLLMQAQVELLVFADDDLIFYDNYLNVVKKAYKKYNADVILFNLGTMSDNSVNVSKVTRVNKLNYQRYGGARLTVRRSSIVERGLYFNMMFGGGALVGSGEDTLFLKECLDAKLKVIHVPFSLAYLDTDSRPSTWFNGYNEKYFRDKGYLFHRLHGYKKHLYILRFIFLHKVRYKLDFSFFEMWRWMVEGRKINS